MAKDVAPTEFFDHFAAAWDGFDAAAILDYVAVPHLLVTEGRSSFLESETELHATIDALIAHWRERGVAHVRLTKLEQQPLPDRAARARADWQLEDAAGAELLHFTIFYTLAEEDGDWAIMVTDLQGLATAAATAGWALPTLG